MAGSYPLPPHAQAHLWSHLKAHSADILKQQPTIDALISDLAASLELREPTPASADGAGSHGLRHLLAPASLASTVERLKAHYAVLWPGRTAMDDTFFLLPQTAQIQTPSQRTPVPLSPCRASVRTGTAGPSSAAGSSRANSPAQAARAVLLTPLRGANPLGRTTAVLPKTPITAQLESVGWLRNSVAGSADPSIDLQRYYDACDQPPAAAIATRLAQLIAKVQSAMHASGLAGDVAEQLEFASTLYRKMLLSFLRAEERRLKQRNFTALLYNDAFHTSLLGCCLESVFASCAAILRGRAFKLRALIPVNLKLWQVLKQ